MKKPEFKEKILELRKLGWGGWRISKAIGCSKSLVAYYCSPTAKKKCIERINKKRLIQHPFVRKIETFKGESPGNGKKYSNDGWKKSFSVRMHNFKSRGNKMGKPFTLEDVIKKVGENPVCYLTGLPIDVNKPRTYQFDHIIPVSRGGDNSLDNLEICTATANYMKYDQTLDELENMCKLMLEKRGWKVTKPNLGS